MAAAGAMVVCCAGPTLLVLAATGLGVGAIHAGAFLLAGIGVIAALSIGSLVWWRRRACARSVVPTRHRIRRDGTIIYANCAIDALAVPFMVDEIVRIESDCAHCGEAVMMQMSGECIQAVHPGSLVVFHVARECCEAGPAILTRCPYINFFCGADHADRWRADNPGRLGDVLSLPQAIARARERFASTISLVRSEEGSHDAKASAAPREVK